MLISPDVFFFVLTSVCLGFFGIGWGGATQYHSKVYHDNTVRLTQAFIKALEAQADDAKS